MSIYDQHLKQCGVVLPPEPFVFIDPSPIVPPPTLWLSDPDGWALYAGVDVEPVSSLEERIKELTNEH